MLRDDSGAHCGDGKSGRRGEAEGAAGPFLGDGLSGIGALRNWDGRVIHFHRGADECNGISKILGFDQRGEV